MTERATDNFLREGVTLWDVITSAEEALLCAGSTEPRAEAFFLASHGAGLKISEINSRRGERAPAGLLRFMADAVSRRGSREPSQYITGAQEFYGLDFCVTPDVLIPRPDTELLVGEALAFLKARKAGKGSRAMDLCTGSGCIAISLAINCPGVIFDATDISASAIKVARQNAQTHNVSERISFYEGDLFDVDVKDGKYALITANPPYIADSHIDTLDPEVKLFEPRVALSGGPEGLDIIRRVVTEVPKHLESAGMFVMEMGFGQADAVKELFEEAGMFVEIEIRKDLSGIERVIKAVKA